MGYIWQVQVTYNETDVPSHVGKGLLQAPPAEQVISSLPVKAIAELEQ